MMIKNSLIPALALSTILFGCEGKDAPLKPAAEPAAAPPPSPPAREREARAAPITSYAEAVERVSAGVVTIRAARRTRAPRQHPFFDNPALRDFFGGAQQRGPALQMGLGSGVIVKTDGAIITNHHVIDGAEQIKVELQNNRVYDAKVVGTDPPSDLAVLQIDARDLSALNLGNSDRVRVGDVVLAIGNPLGIGQTVTAGIISAKGRSTGLSDGSFEDFLQTDAPINQGNSGGALVNTEGELVGINSQILSTSGGSIGIGFAVPSNMARNVLDQLIANGRVRRGQLGVAIEPLTPEKAAQLGRKDAPGVIVGGVAPQSPAARAGLRAGDVIVSFQGEPVRDGNTLRNRIASTAPETKTKLTVLREGQEREIDVILGEYNPERRAGERR